MKKKRILLIIILLILSIVLVLGFSETIFAEELNLKITGIINNYGSDIWLKTYPNSNNGIDPYDMFAPPFPSDYSSFYSTVAGAHVSIDSWNANDNPRTLNLTYNISDAQTGNIDFSWNSLSGTNYSGNLTYYADNSSYLNPISSVDMSDVSSYNNSISDKSYLYLQVLIRDANTAPTISLTTPADNNITTDRTPTFTYDGVDPEGDTLVYDINITCYGGCSADNNVHDQEDYEGGESYISSTDFAYLYDNNYYYTWSVRACENATADLFCSDWATLRTINITALVQISLPTSFTDFGDMGIGDSQNTTNDTINPFVIQNDGNSKVNISMNATQLWDSIAYEATNYFMAKIRAYIGNATWAQTSWFQLPPITGLTVIASDLNYTDTSDDLTVDLLLDVPQNEPPGGKTSTINFQAELSET